MPRTSPRTEERAAIAEMWERERTGPDETFEMSSEIVAVDGDTGVARVEVSYGDPVEIEYRDLWIVRLDGDGRCVEFEEWLLAARPEGVVAVRPESRLTTPPRGVESV